MSLSPGSRVGPCEIVSAIGAGAMGEVYRARDTALNRDVAIKVLPESFARDPERVARFTREAQTLASLNHPNIAQIVGLETSTGQHALVMDRSARPADRRSSRCGAEGENPLSGGCGTAPACSRAAPAVSGVRS